MSNRAFTQARANLKHTAFIALNDSNIEMYYGDGLYERYNGFRVLAIDGSKVRLPKGAEIKEQYGAISYENQKEEVKGEHNYSQLSVLYDHLYQFNKGNYGISIFALFIIMSYLVVIYK